MYVTSPFSLSKWTSKSLCKPFFFFPSAKRVNTRIGDGLRFDQCFYSNVPESTNSSNKLFFSTIHVSIIYHLLAVHPFSHVVYPYLRNPIFISIDGRKKVGKFEKKLVNMHFLKIISRLNICFF